MFVLRGLKSEGVKCDLRILRFTSLILIQMRLLLCHVAVVVREDSEDILYFLHFDVVSEADY